MQINAGPCDLCKKKAELRHIALTMGQQEMRYGYYCSACADKIDNVARELGMIEWETPYETM